MKSIRTFDGKTFAENFLNQRKATTDIGILKTAQDIIADVQENGQKAVEKYVERFDGKLPENWIVTDEEKKQAWEVVSPELVEALKAAAENIRNFHAKQLQTSRMMNTTDNVVSGQLFTPIERVGLYVPGGTATYPSTVLMNAIPAKIAGVKDIIMTTPAKDDGSISPVLCVAADIVGVKTIYKIGGIQAIAALAYGTEIVDPVHKIVGPGNAFVATAKKLVYGDVGIDMIAGPSEVAIIADDSADPSFIAADLIAQSEHDMMARAFLFTTSEKLIKETELELTKQCDKLPRKDIASESLKNQGALIKVDSLDEAFKLTNDLAPEHLEIQCKDPLTLLSKVKNAGSVFLGKYTPEPIGDYFAGPNHVLPTQGNAKFSSGLSVDDFVKKTTFLYYSQEALQIAAPHVQTIANEEHLEGHARAVKIRLEDK